MPDPSLSVIAVASPTRLDVRDTPRARRPPRPRRGAFDVGEGHEGARARRARCTESRGAPCRVLAVGEVELFFAFEHVPSTVRRAAYAPFTPLAFSSSLLEFLRGGGWRVQALLAVVVGEKARRSAPSRTRRGGSSRRPGTLVDSDALSSVPVSSSRSPTAVSAIEEGLASTALVDRLAMRGSSRTWSRCRASISSPARSTAPSSATSSRRWRMIEPSWSILRTPSVVVVVTMRISSPASSGL